MVLRCNVKGCRRMSSMDKDHSFFRLPKDAETRDKWLKFLGPKNCYGSIRICTDHFDNDQIRKKFPRPLLIRNALPTIKPTEKSSQKSQNQKSVEGKHTESRLPETAEQNRVSPPRTQMKFRITDNHTASHLPVTAEQNKTSSPRTHMEFRVTDNHTESRLPETAEENKISSPRTQMEFRITDNHTESHLSETAEQDRASPPRTQIINIHANNVGQIVISDENRKIIVNIINDSKNPVATY
ncbi:THAP domain-containing protein 1-like [Diprion similis]|uniref:THAP domain-containing protein 1-like n=1 Tax=Diprion similis TaxID=362088 RepID=UPI001EF8169A|nr:THAP domain-containing protein 1-like [Diprion similis]